MKIDSIQCKLVSELLFAKAKKIAIVPHVNPDGDALGSSVGLSRVLQNAGFETAVVFPNNFPKTFSWLCDGVKVLNYEADQIEAEKVLAHCDMLFYLDFNDIKRVGKLSEFIETLKKPLVLIDHHPEPSVQADFLFSDTSFSSTSELVTAFIVEAGLESHLDKMAANALLTGIITDTGSFNHNASRPDLYLAVAKLIAKGAEKDRIHECVFNNFTENRMRLLGYCLSQKMEIFPEFRASLIWLTREELDQYNFQIGDTEGFVNYPLSITGIVFSAFFIEKEGYVKASFRSKGSFPANEFSASHFKGGGHRNAAGGESDLPIKQVLSQFKELLPEYKQLLLSAKAD